MNTSHVPGFENRIREYIDSLRIVDTHEHLFTPEIIKGSFFLDFMLLFQPNGYDDLKSAGMPPWSRKIFTVNCLSQKISYQRF